MRSIEEIMVNYLTNEKRYYEEKLQSTQNNELKEICLKEINDYNLAIEKLKRRIQEKNGRI